MSLFIYHKLILILIDVKFQHQTKIEKSNNK